MEIKKKTPLFTVIFYILGLVFLAVGVFMLYGAINYMKGYLQSYEMTFNEMAMDVLQYVITQCGAYFGFGVVSLGIGKAIKEARNAAAGITVPEIEIPEVKLPETVDVKSEAIDSTLDKVEALTAALEEFKVVTEIKLDEMDKRDSYRIKETKDMLTEYMGNRVAAESLILKKLGILDEDEELEAAAVEDTAEADEAECPIDEETGEPEVTVEFIEEGEDEEETADDEDKTEVVYGPVRRVRRFLK